MRAQRANGPYPFSLALAVALAEHRLSTRLVPRGGKNEPRYAIAARPIKRPPGQETRHLRHIRLAVAAVDAERVQFEQFARVILIEAALGKAVGLDPKSALAWSRLARVQLANARPADAVACIAGE